MNERETEEAFLDWCDKVGACCYKLRIDGLNGFPDRTFIWKGTVVFIEFKRYDGKLRPMQEVVIKALEDQGANVIVTDSLDEAIEFCLECTG